MKTIQEFYKELVEDKELTKALVEAANAGKLEDFLKEHDCDATLEEVSAFFKEMDSEDEPLSFDELEHAAGGNALIDIGNFIGSLGVIACVIRSACDKEDAVCQIQETGVGPGIGVVKL